MLKMKKPLILVLSIVKVAVTNDNSLVQWKLTLWEISVMQKSILQNQLHFYQKSIFS